ncbi:hypothetical protein N7457_002335 [Penicillium paradoxum]|uniref:uncharacterized protein n=1 Tax=Penicillium paradoxum TaxID=176176 RepID=UPI00254692BF|nr:uncharacterized protein N7457_002335 [Penicillium paradoxum]KAJ5787345.1 hypothetical protein N7457_002335 [Penicillium paradoxum]
MCIYFLALGLSKVGSSAYIWKQQLGTPIPDTLITGRNWPTSLMNNVLIANSPQLIFSLLYFSFNTLLTSMTLAAEWSGYASQRKGLRVSYNPQLSQRSKYFLSIPYRYSIPLIAAAAILHWLVSRSLFMVGIEALDSNMVRNLERDLITCGYSPVAIVCSLVVGGCMFLCLVGLSAKPFETAMPVAGGCSLAIAAACHPAFDPTDNVVIKSNDEDTNMAHLPVQWGSVPVDGRVGHYSFTSEDVEMPKAGKIYK